MVKVREGVETKDRRAEATRRERETREVGGGEGEGLFGRGGRNIVKRGTQGLRKDDVRKKGEYFVVGLRIEKKSVYLQIENKQKKLLSQ